MGSDRRIPAAECTEYPWWVIIDPDVIHGLFGKDQRVGRVAAALTGPFLSRAEAQAQLDRRRYAYGPNAVVYSLSGHDSSDWRALCHEDPVERDALRARAEAAEQRAEAAEQRAEAAEAALAAARVAWSDAVENFHNIDRHGEATEICEWACALRNALANAEPDWGAAGGGAR